MLLAKREKQDKVKEMKLEREMREKEQREKLNEKIQKKIVEKALKITKKRNPIPSKKELLALLDDDDDDEPEPEPEPEPVILKKRTPPVKQLQPKTTQTKPPLVIKFV